MDGKEKEKYGGNKNGRGLDDTRKRKERRKQKGGDITKTRAYVINLKRREDRKNKMIDIITNMKIETFMDIKNNILPSEEYLKFNIIKIHEEFDISKIVNNIDENIFCSMLDLQIYRMILELIPNTEYIYLNFIKNDQIFKNNRFSLKQIINSYLKNNDFSILDKHIEYFRKAKSDFDLPLNKKVIINIYNMYIHFGGSW